MTFAVTQGMRLRGRGRELRVVAVIDDGGQTVILYAWRYARPGKANRRWRHVACHPAGFRRRFSHWERIRS